MSESEKEEEKLIFHAETDYAIAKKGSSMEYLKKLSLASRSLKIMKSCITLEKSSVSVALA